MKVVLLALVVTLTLTACGGSDDRTYAGIVLDPAPSVGDLSLPDAARGGAETALRGPQDGVLLAYLGFTHCPDVCPTTLADVKGILADLPKDERERVDVAMITIDPERDTAEVLPQYVAFFAPDGRALRTDDAERLRAVATALGASYNVREGTDGTPEVSHTAALYAIDPDGQMLVQWPFGTTKEVIAADLALALDDTRNRREIR
jgi:protein SCO1/2